MLIKQGSKTSNVFQCTLQCAGTSKCRNSINIQIEKVAAFVDGIEYSKGLLFIFILMIAGRICRVPGGKRHVYS